VKPSKLQELARKYREAQRWWLKCEQARRDASKCEPGTDAVRRHWETTITADEMPTAHQTRYWHAEDVTTRWLHYECQLRGIVGSVGHQRGLCSCRGGPGTMDDPPGVSKREAARAAVAEWRKEKP